MSELNKPFTEYIIFKSNLQQLLVLIEYLRAFLSILLPSYLHSSKFLSESLDRLLFGSLRELFSQFHQLINLLYELFVYFHPFIKLSPNDLVLKYNVFTMLDGYQLVKELFIVASDGLVKNRNQIVHTLSMSQRYVAQEVGLMNLGDDVEELVGDCVQEEHVLLTELLRIFPLDQLDDG